MYNPLKEKKHPGVLITCNDHFSNAERETAAVITSRFWSKVNARFEMGMSLGHKKITIEGSKISIFGVWVFKVTS